MLVVNVIIFVVYMLLAIISRLHFSKYKGFARMADVIFDKTKFTADMQKTQDAIRRINVISPKDAEGYAKDYYVRRLTCVIIALFVTNCLCLGIGIYERKNMRSDYVLSRDKQGGHEKDYDIALDYEGEKETFTLNVMPLEYTKEQFDERCEALFAQYEEILKGENEDLLHIKGDIIIPTEDCDFYLNWTSGAPDLISSTGQVNRENITEKVYVTLYATLEYKSYENTREYVIGVVPEEATRLEVTKNILNDMEADSRSKKSISLPARIDGVNIILQREENNTPVQIFVLGIIVCIVLFAGDGIRLRNKVAERDRMLMDLFPDFVEKLCLFLSAGLTVKAGIKNIITMSNNENILVLELKYTINQIDSGIDEIISYGELGSRLGVAPYKKLMNLICQNLRIGTRDLLKLMEDELVMSTELKTDSIKRRGQIASTKLLAPMTVLLLVVMLIIITPIFISL